MLNTGPFPRNEPPTILLIAPTLANMIRTYSRRPPGTCGDPECVRDPVVSRDAETGPKLGGRSDQGTRMRVISRGRFIRTDERRTTWDGMVP
jgi:hypothetical protein